MPRSIAGTTSIAIIITVTVGAITISGYEVNNLRNCVTAHLHRAESTGIEDGTSLYTPIHSRRLELGIPLYGMTLCRRSAASRAGCAMEGPAVDLQSGAGMGVTTITGSIGMHITMITIDLILISIAAAPKPP